MTRVQEVLSSLGLLTPDPSWTRTALRHPKLEQSRFRGAPRVDGHVLGTVYIAQSAPDEPVKIGWAINAARRVKQVATECRVPGLRVIATIEGIRVDEGRMHRALDASRKGQPLRRYPFGPVYWARPGGREWFWPTDDVRRVVESLGGCLFSRRAA